MSIDRTFMSWTRTAVSLIGFGWREGLPRWRFSNLIAVVVIAIGLVAFWWIVVSS